jgi:phage host-nuclease inhibitor protein Gam
MAKAPTKKELEPINEKYNGKFDTLKAEMESQFETIKQYCEENRKELFVEAKHIEDNNAVMGFREGKEKVIILEGFVEKDIVAVLEKRKAWQPFVRYTPALDKVKLTKEKPKGMEKLGFKVGREEVFFLDPIKTEVPA